MKKVINFLLKLVLVMIMMGGAAHAMKHGFGWYQFWGLIMFTGALTIWSVMEYHNGYKHGENDGKLYGNNNAVDNERLSKRLDTGENEISHIVPNELAHKYVTLFGRNSEFCSDNNQYKYYISSIEVLNDMETEVKLTKVESLK